jgi:hypothetical protein
MFGVVLVLRFEMPDADKTYKGTGVSQGLDRGLLVYYGEDMLVEEGMGLGACALQADGFTYFATVKSVKRDGPHIEVEYAVDRRLEYRIFGVRSKLLTKLQEQWATNFYMKYEKAQEWLLKCGDSMKRLFKADLVFAEVPAVGFVRTRYEIGDNFVNVDVSCISQRKDLLLFIMNEAGGSLFDRSINQGTVSAAPTGWCRMPEKCELYSDALSLAFTMVERGVPENISSKLYWGREHIEGTCAWSGFESEIQCGTGSFENYRYTIIFRG